MSFAKPFQGGAAMAEYVCELCRKREQQHEAENDIASEESAVQRGTGHEGASGSRS